MTRVCISTVPRRRSGTPPPRRGRAPRSFRECRSARGLDTLLISADPGAAAPHEVEPFGPAATVLAYRDTAHAVDLVARGQAAPWHGRLHHDADHRTRLAPARPEARRRGRAGGGVAAPARRPVGQISPIERALATEW
jgi:acyl-CoA reductase-like NAD-dependent aldehyde dehydrogenase